MKKIRKYRKYFLKIRREKLRISDKMRGYKLFCDQIVGRWFSVPELNDLVFRMKIHA